VRSHLVRTTLLAAVSGLLVMLVAVCHSGTARLRADFPPDQDVLFLPKPGFLRVASLGHHELAADLVWVDAVVYAGTELTSHGSFSAFVRYFDTVAELDPGFKRPYKWAGVLTMYNGRRITNETVWQSNHVLEVGAQRFPRDWELQFMLGCNYLNELKTTDPEQRKKWDQIAAGYIRRAAVLGGGPAWLGVLAAQVYTRTGRSDLAMRHLEEVLATTENATVREQVRVQLEELRATTAANSIDASRQQVEAQWTAWARYAPIGLYALVGEPAQDRTLADLVDDPLLHDPDAAERAPAKTAIPGAHSVVMVNPEP
jgi:hypothetical protein